MPAWLSDLAYRVRRFVNRRAAEDDMASEMASHVELETERLVREGTSPAEARRQALLAFGGIEQTKDAPRVPCGWRPISRCSRPSWSSRWRSVSRPP